MYLQVDFIIGSSVLTMWNVNKLNVLTCFLKKQRWLNGNLSSFLALAFKYLKIIDRSWKSHDWYDKRNNIHYKTLTELYWRGSCKSYRAIWLVSTRITNECIESGCFRWKTMSACVVTSQWGLAGPSSIFFSLGIVKDIVPFATHTQTMVQKHVCGLMSI